MPPDSVGLLAVYSHICTDALYNILAIDSGVEKDSLKYSIYSINMDLMDLRGPIQIKNE